MIHLYKYMRIYLWSALRIMVLRMGDLRKADSVQRLADRKRETETDLEFYDGFWMRELRRRFF